MNTLRRACSKEAWVVQTSEQFNRALIAKDFGQIAEFYDPVALMTHKPGQSYLGRDDIACFWKKWFATYAQPAFGNILKVSVKDQQAGYVDSYLSYDRGRGLIMKEHWLLNDNGSAQLVYHTLSLVGLTAKPVNYGQIA